MTMDRPLPKLIACLNDPLLDPPGHVIKLADPPYTPLAHVVVFPSALDRIRDERTRLTVAMAAAPEMLAALERLSGWLCCRAIASDADVMQAAPEMQELIEATIAKAKPK